MSQFDNLSEKARQAAAQNPDQVNQGIDQAGDMADQKTGGRHGQHIDQGAEQLKNHLGTGQNDQQGQQDQNQQ